MTADGVLPRCRVYMTYLLMLRGYISNWPWVALIAMNKLMTERMLKHNGLNKFCMKHSCSQSHKLKVKHLR